MIAGSKRFTHKGWRTPNRAAAAWRSLLVLPSTATVALLVKRCDLWYLDGGAGIPVFILDTVNTPVDGDGGTASGQHLDLITKTAVHSQAVIWQDATSDSAAAGTVLGANNLRSISSTVGGSLGTNASLKDPIHVDLLRDQGPIWIHPPAAGSFGLGIVAAIAEGSGGFGQITWEWDELPWNPATGGGSIPL